MVLLDIDSWLKDNAKLAAGILALIGSLLGFVLRKVYDRYFSDNFVPADTLLGKLQIQTLSSKGIKRLAGELEASTVKLLATFKNTYENSKTVLSLNENHQYFAKAISEDIHHTNCPRSEANRRLFFLDATEINQRPVFELSSLAKVLDVRLSEKLKESKNDIPLFQNRILINGDIQFYFWINASNYFPENNLRLKEDYASVENIIQKWLPGVTVIVEMYISKDIAGKATRFINDPGIIACINPVVNEFTKLVLLRNAIYDEFLNGKCFGSLSYIHDPIPEELIRTRCEEAERVFTGSVLNIFGPPGAGKTFLTQKIIESQVSKKVLVLILNSTELINAFAENIVVDMDSETCYDSIIGLIMNGKYNLLLPLCTQDNLSLKTTNIILKTILKEKLLPFLLVIDDYYLYKEAIEKKLIDLMTKGWGVRLMLIGRPPTVELYDRLKQDIRKYECRNWNRNEALLIMNSWTANANAEINSAMEIEWLVKEERFSVYLLRLIIKNMNDIEGHTLSDILRKELISSLNPIFQNLTSSENKHQLTLGELRASLENLISFEGDESDIKREIQSLLAKRTELDIDKFINSIGELSWASRFQASGIVGGLSNELIAQYLPFFDVASFRKVASEGNIFKYSRGEGSMDWNDNLIADGCLSILLRRNLETIGNQENRQLQFSGMLEGLRNHNSLNILSLVLDSNAIIKMTKIIGLTNFSRIDLIDELLTEQNLARLKDEGKVETMAYTLIQGVGQNDDTRDAAKVAKLVRKLSVIDANLKTFLQQSAGRGDFSSKVSINVLAYDYKNNGDFYKLMDSLGIDRQYSTEVSISCCNNIDLRLLLDRFNGMAIDIAVALWLRYLAPLSGDEVFSLTIELLCNYEFKESGVNLALMEGGLRDALDKKKASTNSISAKSNLYRTIAKCWTDSRFGFCSVAMKYYVFFDVPILFKKNEDWVVHTRAKYGTTKRPLGLNNIATVSGIFSGINKRYEIAFSPQLAEQDFNSPIDKSSGPELIGDYLMEHEIRAAQLPNNYKLVDFRTEPFQKESLTFNDTKSNSTKVFYWRPIFHFNK